MEKAFQKRLLQGVPAVANAELKAFEVDRLCDCLKHIILKKGRVFVIKENMSDIDEAERGIYLIKHGSVFVTSVQGTTTELKSSDHLDLLSEAAASGMEDSVISVNEDTVCHLLHRSSFMDVLGNLDRLRKPIVSPKVLDHNTKLKNFERRRIIGQGVSFLKGISSVHGHLFSFDA